uniref:Uncharacterized protein n=1 Tax=Knipowitschia caucasica TaxID=637954 RepID=A0AAV2JI84_KNICA
MRPDPLAKDPFTSVRVTAKYHGIKLEYQEHRHVALNLLNTIKTKLKLWRRPYLSSEGVRLLLQEWHGLYIFLTACLCDRMVRDGLRRYFSKKSAEKSISSSVSQSSLKKK